MIKKILFLLGIVIYIIIGYRVLTPRNYSKFDDLVDIKAGQPLQYRHITYDDVSFGIDCDDPRYKSGVSNKLYPYGLEGCDDDTDEFKPAYLAVDLVIWIIPLVILGLVIRRRKLKHKHRYTYINK